MPAILISLDPGKDNFAFCCMTKNAKILEYGMISNTILEMKFADTFTKQTKLFIAEVKRFLKILPKASSYRIVYERFIPRSLHKGNLGELTNIMIGMLLATSNLKTECVVPITAAAWKCFLKKHDLYFSNKNLTQHSIDSMCIGFYYLHKNEYITFEQLQKSINKWRE